MRPVCAGSRHDLRLFLIFLKNSDTLLVKVVKLTSINGPSQHAEDEEHQDNGQRQQQIEDVHVQLLSTDEHRSESVPTLRALSTTASELSAMPNPASHGGRYPTTASGMQVKL